MKIVACLITIALVASGCTRLSDAGFDRTRLFADVAKGGSIWLADYSPFNWDRVHIFGPYTPAAVIKEEVGRSVPFPHSGSESHCLLVFLWRGEIKAAFEVERKAADFAELIRKGGYSPEEAVFGVEIRAADRWRYLKKKD